MGECIRPPDDVYWHFRRLKADCQVGAEYTSHEDGFLYRVNAERRICRMVEGVEHPTIDSLPTRLPAGAHVLTGVGWGFRMHISTFYQQVIAPSAASRPDHDQAR
jgi:hypothetical protein